MFNVKKDNQALCCEHKTTTDTINNQTHNNYVRIIPMCVWESNMSYASQRKAAKRSS